MDRKKTILIAVMINAGLLVLLFIGALVSQDETVSEELAQKTITPPLFTEMPSRFQEIGNAPGSGIQPTAAVAAFSPQQQTSLASESSKIPESAPMHRLPTAAVEVAVAPPMQTPTLPLRSESNLVEVTVKKGDSLDKIAKSNNTTVDEIIKLNQLPGSFLKIGQVLKLPDAKIAAQQVKAKPPQVEKSIASNPEYYTVKVGDNPWGIAMKHHMKVEELLKLNHLNEERARKLKPGDRLRIR